MKQFNVFLLLNILILIGLFPKPALATNAIYEQRRSDYIDSSLVHFSQPTIVLQAYRHLPVDSASLYTLLGGFTNNNTSDFDLNLLIRILYLAPGTYDSVILATINPLPYWINKGDTVRGYWSENHMIQWMADDWLLHEKFGKPVDSGLYNRLTHYLDLKNTYGFYEFYSSVYGPYCLSGLLNLADFAQDSTIKAGATKAAQRLLKNFLFLTNDKGVFYPTAGRNYAGKYDSPYDQNHNNLIYLLTGFGQAPSSASQGGAMLASSSLFVDSVITSWRPTIDTTFYNGHTLDSGLVLNSTQRPVDKVVFQWSSGAYFHPEVVIESAELLTDSVMWHHVDFAPFRPFATQPIANFVPLATGFSCISESSVICGEQISAFKHNSITLSSVQDFWKGKLGFQQYPCVANVGATAVYTASGVTDSNWDNRSATNGNNDLPYVQQKKNIALLMYRPEAKLSIVGFNKPQVSLHFNDGDYDEIRNDSNWLLGRQGTGYVAVRRSCIDTSNGVRYCPTAKGQAWVIVVGDSLLYGSFNQFQAKIDSSKYTEQWYYDSIAQQSIFFAKIVFDTTTIQYAWGVDSVATGINNINVNSTLKLYPNPTNDMVTLDASGIGNQAISIKVINMLGQIIYTDKTIATQALQITTNQWQTGLYFVTVETENGRYTAKLIKE